MIEKDQKDINRNRHIAAASYIWVLCLIPLLFKRESKFAQFHAKQGLLLFIIEIFGFILFLIPIIGQILFFMVILYSIIGFKKALDGKYWSMPLLNKVVNKINIQNEY